MQRVIGIDFGTSTTYMNVKRYNGNQPLEDTFSYLPVLFEYGGSSGFVATIIRENADGSFDFGEKASEPLEGSKVHREFKMRLESPDPAEREEARRLTREFFRFLYATYTRQAASLGSPDDEVETMVSYPVKWQPETVRFMLSAAREAGFENVIGLDEATAAVSAVLCHDREAARLLAWDRPGYLLLIDMGAGTTDLVVCRYEIAGGGIQVRRVLAWPQGEGEPAFGGREIDEALTLWLEDYLGRSLPSTMAPMAGDIVRSPGEVKKWKENNVSPILAEKGRVTGCGFLQAYKSVLTEPFPSFDRAAFERWPGILRGLGDYARLLNGCLGTAVQSEPSVEGQGVDMVLLTGGHSAWYFAREMLTGAMPGVDHPALASIRREPGRVLSVPNPQSTVSLGLVYGRLPLLQKKGTEPPAPDEKEETKPSVPGEKEETPPAADPEEEAIYRRAAELTPQLLQLSRTGANLQLRSVLGDSPRAEELFQNDPFFGPFCAPGETILCYAEYLKTLSMQVVPVLAVTRQGIALREKRLNQQLTLTWTEFLSAALDPAANNGAFLLKGLFLRLENSQIFPYLTRLQSQLRQQFAPQEIHQGAQFITQERKITQTVQNAMHGAKDIISQRLQNSGKVQQEAAIREETRASGLFTVKVTRKAKLQGAGARMYVAVDNDHTYELGAGRSVFLQLAEGPHTLAFMNNTSGRNSVLSAVVPAVLNLQVTRDMDLTAEYVTAGMKTGFRVKEGPMILL